MCGVFGIFGHEEASKLTYLGLHALQHRGQESAGIVSSDGTSLKSYKQMGLVADVFSAYGTQVTLLEALPRIVEKMAAVVTPARAPLSNIENTTFAAGVLYNKSTDVYSFLSITNVSGINVVRPAGDGTFWIGGPFTDAGGVASADYLCKWNPATGAVTGFGAGAVSGVGVDGIYVSQTGYVYVFGQFTQIGGATSGNVARYNPVTGVFEVWGNTNGRVRGIVESPGRVWIYGDFTTVNGGAGRYGRARSISWPW